jgi:hypothetical protein
MKMTIDMLVEFVAQAVQAAIEMEKQSDRRDQQRAV